MHIRTGILMLIFPALLAANGVYAQSGAADSIRNLLQGGTEDSIKVFRYYQYGELYEQSKPDSADFYFRKGLELAKKLNYQKGIFSYTSYAIVLLNNKGKYLEGLALTQESVEQATQFGNIRDQATAYINVANEWQYLGDLETAAAFYLKAAEQASGLPEKKFERVALNNLASVFIELKDWDKVIAYASKALFIARQMKDDYSIASCLINLAVGKTNKGQIEEAIALYNQVFTIGQQTEDYILRLDGLNGLGEVFLARKDLKTSVRYFHQTLKLAGENEDPVYAMYANGGLASSFSGIGQRDSAVYYVLQAIRIARENNASLELKNYCLEASGLYEQMGNFKAALDYQKQFQLLSDSLLGEKSNSAILLAEAKFQGKQKEQQLLLQQSSIRQKSMLNYVFIGSTIALLLISLLTYRNYRQKRKLSDQRIADLEREKQLSATQSLLRGQEEERNRMARDLHDGLGGLLSGVKLQLGAMKGNLVLSEEMGRTFNNALNKLDESINEMRRVAHNMMPEALLKLGLQQALQDYCDGLSESSGGFRITGEFHGLDKRLDASTEVVVYRIVQELLNNAVKHSGADQILAQVMRQEQALTITVEDNGKGYDIADPDSKSGAGLRNIRSRVDYLKGQLDIQSLPGKGTSIHIDCLIDNHE
ncbi:MAG TPA: tetratricopeptide repeat protein [Chitinophagaceae bacterium]|nr:tetratricopeptide repeat protein [Chitinophagaceae bacterium]